MLVRMNSIRNALRDENTEKFSSLCLLYNLVIENIFTLHSKSIDCKIIHASRLILAFYCIILKENPSRAFVFAKEILSKRQYLNLIYADIIAYLQNKFNKFDDELKSQLKKNKNTKLTKKVLPVKRKRNFIRTYLNRIINITQSSQN